MDDQDTLRTYGNRNLPEGTEDRPLVTFALFAYNQEKYIREAVEGAFAQTYTPLEIILSDDYSTDDTFKIMKEMVAEYPGPNKVVVRQNEKNLGLIGHVNRVCEEMSGSILILAAGDDISFKDRTLVLSSIFTKNPNVVLAHSSALTIDETGEITGVILPPKPKNLEEIVKSASIYIGATGAIHKRLIDEFEPIRYPKTYEDLIFGTRAALVGETRFIDREIVKYRKNVGIISRSKEISGRRNRRSQSIINRIHTLKQRKLDISSTQHDSKKRLLDIIEHEILHAEARLEYHTRPACFIKNFFIKFSLFYLCALSSETKYILGIIS